ncbi:MAG: cell division protein FtsZ [Verrucomicrobia bacterium RIFCSPLOWO2_12_FULL_64_8]|nr:MAG: cell division protein FtsZ [Verrucomicrobia bacterium RIFCSPLOWO2_12_FULL_64_8]
MQFDANGGELPLTHEILTDRSIAIKLVGVGGAGANAVDRLKMENLERLQLAVINTDSQALGSSPVQDKILIGGTVTRGLGAGGDPELGREAAETDRGKIAAVVKECDLVFLLAGMGGGTGGGAAPVVAEVATEQGALVIAFVTMPFTFEGGRRLKQAEECLGALRRVCDAVIPLPNDMLLQECGENTGVLDAFARADEWIGRGVKSIWAMLFRVGLMNLDFATLRQAFQTRGGRTLFGLGGGQGAGAVAQAVENLKLCPLLHTPEFSRKADRLLVNIIGGTDLTLPMVNELMTAITDQFGRESHVIMGAVIDESMQQRIEVCVLGTTDMGGRGVATRRPAASQRASATPFIRTAASKNATATTGDPAGPAPFTETTQPAITGGKPKIKQDEFAFGEIESRGYFDKTDRNLFEGQDLDVPTYLRKGVKINV